MSIEVEGPDGAINEFPDGTPDAVISKAMRQQYGGPSGETTASAGPGVLSRAGDAVMGALGRAEQKIIDTTGIGRKKGSVLQNESDLDAMVRGVAPAPVGTSKPVEGGTRREGLGAGLFGVADQGVRGLAQGAAQMAGLPVDLATMLVNLTPGVQQGRQALGLSPTISRPFLGSDFNKSALDTANDATIGAINSATGANLDLPVREGDNPVERVVNRMGQEIGATSLPIAGAIGKAASLGGPVRSLSPAITGMMESAGERLGQAAAQRGLAPSLTPVADSLLNRLGPEVATAAPAAARQASMEGARAMHPTLAHFVEQAAANPVKFAAKELTTAGAAGSGAGMVNEISRAAGADEHSGAYAAGDLAGALAGAGMFGAAKAIGGAGRDVFNAVRQQSSYVDQTVRDAVVDRLAKATDAPTVGVGRADAYDVGPLARQIETSPQAAIADTVPGYQPTLADTLRDPGVAQLEYGRRTAGSPELARVGAANDEAIRSAIEAQAPQGAVGDLRGALADRRASMRDEVAQAVAAARGRENAAVDAVRPRMTPDVRGAEIRGPLREVAQDAKAQERAAYAGINDGEVPAAPLADAFTQQRDSLSQARRVRNEPGEITSIPGRYVPEPEAPPAPRPEPAAPVPTPEPSAAPAAPSLGLTDLPYRTTPGTEERILQALDGIPPDPTKRRAGSTGGVKTWDLRAALPDMDEQELTNGLFNLQAKGHANLSQFSDPKSVPQGAFSPNIAGRGEDRHIVYPTTEAMERVRARPEPAAPAPAPRAEPTPPPPDEEIAMMPLREVADMRSALRTDHRNALSAGDPNKAAVAQGYIDRIDAFLADHHPNPEGYENARAASVDYNNRFNRPTTDVAQVLRQNEGRPVVPDTSVAPYFARPNTGSQEGLTDLLRETGADSRPREAVADQLRAQADGLRTPEAVQAFMADHSQALERFPALRDQLAERAGAQGYREGQEARSAATDSLYGTDNTRGSTAVGRYLHYGPEQSRAAVRGVLNDAKPAEAARELFDFANRSPEAIAGMRRGLWDEMSATSRRKGETTRGIASGEQPWMPEAASKFLNDPKTRAVLQEAYRDNPEHLADIDRLFETLQGVNTGVRGKAPNSSGTAQGITDVIKSAVSPERLSSDIRTIKRGQMSVGYATTAIAATIARKSVQKAQAGAIDRMLDEALTNPDAAAALLRQNNPVNRAYLQRNSKLWFGDHADRIMAAVNDDADPDPVKEALRRSKR